MRLISPESLSDEEVSQIKEAGLALLMAKEAGEDSEHFGLSSDSWTLLRNTNQGSLRRAMESDELSNQISNILLSASKSIIPINKVFRASKEKAEAIFGAHPNKSLNLQRRLFELATERTQAGPVGLTMELVKRLRNQSETINEHMNGFQIPPSELIRSQSFFNDIFSRSVGYTKAAELAFKSFSEKANEERINSQFSPFYNSGYYSCPIPSQSQSTIKAQVAYVQAEKVVFPTLEEPHVVKPNLRLVPKDESTHTPEDEWTSIKIQIKSRGLWYKGKQILRPGSKKFIKVLLVLTKELYVANKTRTGMPKAPSPLSVNQILEKLIPRATQFEDQDCNEADRRINQEKSLERLLQRRKVNLNELGLGEVLQRIRRQDPVKPHGYLLTPAFCALISD